MVAFDNERTLLEDFVCRCHPFTISVPVTIDAPGVYDIEFDLVHETRTWFAERGARTAAVRVIVE
jgi:hypothetical protein